MPKFTAEPTSVEMMRERVHEAADSCDELELQALTRMIRAFERRRQILTGLERRRDRARRGAVNAGLRELRDAQTWNRPRPSLRILDGGGGDE